MIYFIPCLGTLVFLFILIALGSLALGKTLKLRIFSLQFYFLLLTGIFVKALFILVKKLCSSANL